MILRLTIKLDPDKVMACFNKYLVNKMMFVEDNVSNLKMIADIFQKEVKYDFDALESPRELPVFKCTCKFLNHTVVTQGVGKKNPKQEAARRMLLLLSGDVETNPGPVQSRPVHYRYNDPRFVRLEKALERRDDKIKTLLKELRRQIKSQKIYSQGMFDRLAEQISAGIKDSVDTEQMNSNLTRICDFLETTLPSLQANIQATVIDTTDKCVSLKEDMMKIVLVVLLVRLLMVWKNYRAALCVVLVFIFKFYGFDQKLIDMIMDLKRKIFSQGALENTVEEIVYHPWFHTCGKIIFAVLAFVSIKKIPGKQDWDNYLTRLDRIPKSMDGAKRITDYCSEYFNVANDQIKMMVLGKTKEELQRANGIYGEIQAWAEEVRHYLDLDQRNKIDLDTETANRVEQLWLKGLKFKSEPYLSKEMAALVHTTMLPAMKLYEYVSCSPVKGGGPRMRPICLWLVGESGVGKTEMVYPLCIDVLRTMGMIKKDDFHHQVYGRQVETEFWDGYKGQKIVIYDDAFQKKDDKTAANPEIFEVIRSCNTFPQHLHMAALHDKNTFSAAELLLYTTNDYNVKLESITFPDAFFNRMGDMAYKVQPKKEYGILTEKGNSGTTYLKLDKSKLDKTKAIDLSVYEFQKIVRDEKSDAGWIESGAPIDYETFATTVCTKWKEAKQSSMDKLKFLEEYAIRAQVEPEEKSEYGDCFDFVDDIARRIVKGETLEEIEFEYASDPEIFAQYFQFKSLMKPASRWQKYKDRMDICLSNCRTYLARKYEEIKKVISEHPILTALGMVGVALSAMAMYHWFSKTFDSVKPEVAPSGDARTVRLPRKLVEVGASGDAKTQKTVKPVVESEWYRDDDGTIKISCDECGVHRTSTFNTMTDEEFDNVNYEDLNKYQKRELAQWSTKDSWLGKFFLNRDRKKKVGIWAEMERSGDAKTQKNESEWYRDDDGKLKISCDECGMHRMSAFNTMTDEEFDNFSYEDLNKYQKRELAQWSAKDSWLGKFFLDRDRKKKVGIWAEVGQSGDSKTNKAQVKRVEADAEELTAVAATQGCSDDAAQTLMVDVFQKNTYRMSYFRGDKRHQLGNCTFVRGWSFIMPYHFLQALFARKLPPNTIVSFSQQMSEDLMQIPLSHFFNASTDDFTLSENCVQIPFKNGDFRDCVLVNLHSRMCTPHRDLVRHFVKASDQGMLKGIFSGAMATFHVNNMGLYRVYNWLNAVRPCDKKIEIFHPEDGFEYPEESYIQRDCYEYNAPTRTGDCGSLVGLYNKYLERKIIGMHIAGNDAEEHGYACPLTQECIENACSELIKRNKKNISSQFYYEIPGCVDPLEESDVPEGKFCALGKSSIRVGQAVNSSIIRSKIYGKLSAPIMKPALLKPTILNGKVHNPLLSGLKKCGVDTAVLGDDEVLSAARDVCRVMLNQYSRNLDKSKYQRILSYEEAIRGTQDDEFMCAVNRTTSPGFPYAQMKRSAPGKQHWMGSNENFDFTSANALALRRDVENLIEDCANGRISNVVFVDTLKDERRDIAKVDVGKTRVFSAGPQHFVVAFRQYFLPFAAWLMHNRIDNEIAVGTNVYSSDWERIAKRMKTKGSHVIAGDFGNFDGSLVAQILWAIFWEIFVTWLSQFIDFETPVGERTIRVCLGLWSHLVHSVHIYDDNVYMWTHSQPSGNPFTVIINCLYNSTIMRLSWIRVMEKVQPRLRSMKWFNECVALITYGDDNVLNIDAKVVQWYNQVTISEVMAEMKHEYTDEAKTGEIVKTRTLEDIFFLKRKFRFCPELVRTVAPLKIEVIYEMLNWTRKCADPNVILMTNIETAFREIVLHGREEYDKLRKAITGLKVPGDLPENPLILPYEDYLHDVKHLADPIIWVGYLVLLTQDAQQRSCNIQGTLSAFYMFRLTIELSNRPANFQTNNNNIEDEDRKITSEQKEIVHFSSEGVTPSTTAVPDIVNLSTDYLSMTTREERIHTIKDFLSRPIIIQTGLWNSTGTSSTAGSQLYTANFPEVLISNAMYQEKLRGFVGLRATLVVKVQVNSQPFQQGRLMLQYYPYAQYMPNRVSLVNSTLQGRSGCPRTDLDLSVGTEVEMRIPYVSPHVYYNLITGQGSFGAIYLVVYSQLRDQISGTGSVEYTVWAHLEDVDVQYPTGANVFTGSAPNFANLGQKMIEGNFSEADLRETWKTKSFQKSPDKIFAQVASEIKGLKENGTVSAGIGQISEGLSTMSRIPILGNLFTRPAWISAQASNIFKMLGFSKPTVQGLPCETKLRGQVRMTNFDGVDTSHKMALSVQNEIETKSGLAGTSADEMDLSHVLSIPNFWDRFTWSTSDLTGSNLWDNYVTPMKIKPFSTNIADRFVTTHMGYVANTHGYWRGSIVYTFKFVKTQFHSGRLRISFIPFYYNTTISTGVPDVSRTQKIIVDLRTSTEVSFTVPYVSSRPWMFCIRPESTWLGTDNAMMFNAVSGIVRVEVLNQLVAANSVYQSIDTIVEVSGGPDLTFAAPSAPSYVPYAGSLSAIVDDQREEERKQEYDNNIPAVVAPKIVAQVMGENEAIARNDAQHGVHPMPIDTHAIFSNWSPEAHCIGEKIMSIRQLIKRFGQFFSTSMTSTKPQTIIAPFSVPSPVTTVTSEKTFAMFEYYYFIYAFWRGSMRIKATNLVTPTTITTQPLKGGFNAMYLYNTVQDAFNTVVNAFANGVPVQLANLATKGLTNMGTSAVVVDQQLEGMTEVEVPYYNVSHISPATTYDSAAAPPLSITDVLRGHVPPAVLLMQPQGNIPAAAKNTANFWRAPGDDFSLMYIVGVPPLVNVVRP